VHMALVLWSKGGEKEKGRGSSRRALSAEKKEGGKKGGGESIFRVRGIPTCA